jgi:ABC-type polysaccharide/polyol phosphate export permease
MQGMILVANNLIGNLKIIANFRLSPVFMAVVAGTAVAMNFTIGTLALIPVALSSGYTITFKLVFFPLFFVFASLLLSGAGMLLCYHFLKYEDASQIFTILVMILGYLTPFLYPFDILQGLLRNIVSWNPFTSFVLVFRWMFTDNFPINSIRFLIIMFSSILTFIMGSYWIRKKWNEVVML